MSGISTKGNAIVLDLQLSSQVLQIQIAYINLSQSAKRVYIRTVHVHLFELSS